MQTWNVSNKLIYSYLTLGTEVLGLGRAGVEVGQVAISDKVTCNVVGGREALDYCVYVACIPIVNQTYK